MPYLVGAFSILVAAAGWFYLFYSKSAGRLAAVESNRDNTLRVVCRRTGGVAMILMAILFYAGFVTVDEKYHPAVFVVIWLAVLVLMGLIIILGLFDMRLTMKLRRRRS